MKIPFFTWRKNFPAVAVPSPQPAGKELTPVEIVMGYHEETKHHFHRFARSLGYMDWDTQPNPFRRFEGADAVPMPLLPLQETPTFDECFQPGAIRPVVVSLESISTFFRNSLAVSAWKRFEDERWALRVNPSSGNLHPTEGYIILNAICPDLPAGVYHYAPAEHSLERRAQLSGPGFQRLAENFPDGTFFVGLTSIYWRETWKYGERAFRYSQHDTGHALSALRLSAELLGWQVVLLEELSDKEIAILLGLHRGENFHEAEDEDPDLIAAIIPSGQSVPPQATIAEDAVAQIASVEWSGQANRLSLSHVEWVTIDEVTLHCKKDRTITNDAPIHTANPALLSPPGNLSAAGIIQQRRSAVALDGITTISSEIFYRVLSRVMPQMNPVSFEIFSRSQMRHPRVHLGIFVHRVDGVDPGLYMLVRNPDQLSELKASMHPHFSWKQPPGCPADLSFYLLDGGDLRRIAAGVSCGQDIAGDGVFAMAMIAQFEQPLRAVGPWFYRRLFWEAGFVGQLLYLDAEAAGIRATGIGCYFDDPTHELFGFRDRKFQDLYHFTMGGPVEDTRLTTEPPYPGAPHHNAGHRL